MEIHILYRQTFFILFQSFSFVLLWLDYSKFQSMFYLIYSTIVILHSIFLTEYFTQEF